MLQIDGHVKSNFAIQDSILQSLMTITIIDFFFSQKTLQFATQALINALKKLPCSHPNLANLLTFRSESPKV